MIWIVAILVLVAILGVGTVLEAAFWTLLVVAAVVVVAVLAAARVLGR